MALSTYTTRTLAAGFTQQRLYDELKAAMQVSGFAAPFDEVGTAGSTMEVIFAYAYNASTFGTAYVRITLTTALSVGFSILAGWNASTNTPSGASAIANFTLASANQVNIITINNIEARGICFSGSSSGALLLVRPETKPAWWDENTWPYYFYFTAPAPASSSNRIFSCAAASMPSTAIAAAAGFGPNSTGSGLLTTINPVTGQSDLFSWGLVTTLATSNTMHYGGAFSADLGLVQGTGRNLGDTFNNQWVYGGNGVCFRYA